MSIFSFFDFSFLNVGNVDLLIVGISTAAIGILGFVVFFNNPKSITSRIFLAVSIVASIWGVSNYLNYQLTTLISTNVVLWALRLHLFISVWYAFLIFYLFYVFPETTKKFPNKYKYFLIPWVLFVAILTLTPLVLSELIVNPNVILEAPDTQKGPGIIFFALTVFGLDGMGIYLLIKKTKKAQEKIKAQFSTVLIGIILTLVLILIFNLVLPLVFKIFNFIPLGAVAVLPFILATTYAIVRHKLLDIKIIATEVSAFLIVAVSFLQILTASGTSDVLLGIFIFVALLIISVFLIRTVRKVVEQRALLTIANEKLRELDVQKSEFMALATHQLKAPLTVIKGYASMLKEGSYGAVADTGKEILDRIFGAAQSLVVIIDDFLNISRIEQGRMQYDFGLVDMRQLVSGIVSDMKQGAEQKGLALIFDAPSSVDFNITADFGKIRQVITNLVDNAIKYSPAGQIRVTLLKNAPGGVIRLSVSDTGIGMSAETIGKLFQRFSRAKDVGKAQVGGSGLGLYIAKQMVLAHGGKIWAESGGKGKGSMFYVELPLTPPHGETQNIFPHT